MDQDIPRPRRNWRRRIGLSVIALLALPWLWVSCNLSRYGNDLAAAIAEADRLDPLWRFAELEARRDTPADSENAAVQLLRIVPQFPNSQQLGAAFEQIQDVPPPTRLSDQQLTALKAELAGAGPALTAAYRLPQYLRTRYPVQWKVETDQTVLPCQDARTITNWLRADAFARAEAGDSAGALEACRVMLHASSTIGDEPDPISQIVRISLRSQTLSTLERVLAQGEPPAEALADMHTRLDIEESVPILLYALRADRAKLHAIMPHIHDGEPLYERLVASLKPNANVQRAHAAGLHYHNQLVEWAKTPEAQRAATINSLAKMEKRLPPLAGLLSMTTWKIDEACTRNDAQMRCALAAVAAERFRRSTGRWPGSLRELVVAELLRSELADPYTNGFEPLRIKPLPDGLVIYATGPDRSDNGGTINRLNLANSPDIGFQLWDVAARHQAPGKSGHVPNP